MSSELEGGGRRGQRRAPTKAPVRGNDRDSEFVDVAVGKEQLAEYRVWRQDIEAVDEVWRKAVDDGYKFTVRWDDYSSAVACFMFPATGSDNAGYILTGRGGTPYRALSECLYKHVHILGEMWVGAGNRQRPPDDPDW